MHADKCPVCDGTGRVSHISIDGVGYGEPVTCNGCNGKGWVSVMDSPAELTSPGLFGDISIPLYEHTWVIKVAPEEPEDYTFKTEQAHSNPDLLKNARLS